MILRSITRHVRDQNWFAVGLDFFIVVVGVFIGIQVSNWNDERQEQQRQALILDRLSADFEAIDADVETALETHQLYMDGLQAVIEALDRKTLPESELPAFRNGLRYGYVHINVTGRSGTFSEILASGQVRLVRDEALRAALIEFDNTVLEAEEVFTQIRMHQSAHVAAFTRRFSYAIPAAPIRENGTWQPIGEFDFDAMVEDPEFENAVHELRETQRYYYAWHLRTKNRSNEVRALLAAENPPGSTP